jgi:rsbT co-antagonist protein RsbR
MSHDRLLRALFDDNVDGIAIARPNGDVEVNAAATAMLGGGAVVDSDALFCVDGTTPYPREQLPLGRALDGESVRDVLILSRTEARPEGLWLSVSARPLEDGGAIAVFRDVTVQKRLEDDIARHSQSNVELVERLRLALDELSTPVLEVWDEILALPVVGVIDTQRSAQMTERVLAEVVAKRSKFVIVDLTGVEIVDTSTADRLIKLARSVAMLGAECVISGIQPAVAQTLIDLGVEISNLFPRRNLKRALDYCISRSRRERGH